MDNYSLPSSADIAFRNPLIARKVLEFIVPGREIIEPADFKWLDLRLITRAFKRECVFLLNHKFGKTFEFCFDDGPRRDLLINEFRVLFKNIPLFFKLMKSVKIEKINFVYDELGRIFENGEPKGQEIHMAILKEIALFPTPIRKILDISSSCPSVQEGNGACDDCVIVSRNATELYGPVQLNVVKDLEKPVHWKHLIVDENFIIDIIEKLCVPDLPLAENLRIFETSTKYNTCDVFELWVSDYGDCMAYPKEILKSFIKLWSVKKLIVKSEFCYRHGATEKINYGPFTKYFFENPEDSSDFRIDNFELTEHLIKFVDNVLSMETRKKLDVVVMLSFGCVHEDEPRRFADALANGLARNNFKTQFNCERATELIVRLAEHLPSACDTHLSVWKEDSPAAPMAHFCLEHGFVVFLGEVVNCLIEDGLGVQQNDSPRSLSENYDDSVDPNYDYGWVEHNSDSDWDDTDNGQYYF